MIDSICDQYHEVLIRGKQVVDADSECVSFFTPSLSHIIRKFLLLDASVVVVVCSSCISAIVWQDETLSYDP